MRKQQERLQHEQQQQDVVHERGKCIYDSELCFNTLYAHV
jgi:hypothetical protein